MNKHPLVTVLMITYAHEDYIEEALRGVFMQKTDFPVEFIIANDHSPDQTDHKIKKLLPEAPDTIQVHYILREKNLGMKENFIQALLSAKGKYIAVCEGDDYWTDPLKLQKQVDYMEKDASINFLFHACNRLMPDGKVEPYPTNKIFRKTGIIDKQKLLSKGGGSFATPSLMLRTSMLHDRSLDALYPLVNLDLLIAILAIKNGQVAFLNEVMAMYRVDAKGSWSSQLNLEKKIAENQSNLKALTLFNELTKHRHEKTIFSLKKRLTLLHHYFYLLEFKKFDKEIYGDIQHIGIYNFIRLFLKTVHLRWLRNH